MYFLLLYTVGLEAGALQEQLKSPFYILFSTKAPWRYG